MGKIDYDKSRRIVRRTNGNNPYSPLFQERLTPKAKWYFFMRTKVLSAMRDAEVNPRALPTRDQWVNSDLIKEMTKDLGAEVVGIAKYTPSIMYQDAKIQDHKTVIIFGMAMKYDLMVDIGAESQEEVHRVYFELDEIGVRLAQRIGSMGFEARTHPNAGDFPLPAYGYLAGLGEVAKHGSLVSPELGSSFRLSAVSTDMPLDIDGVQDYGMDEICQKCGICERFCPGGAITPEKREVAGVTRWHVDSDKCQPYFSRLYGCKICLSVCPLTARAPDLRSSYKEMSKSIKDAKDADGMLKMIDEKDSLNTEAFDNIPYDAEDFGGPYIKVAREARDDKNSPIIFDKDKNREK
ncbi:MAG: 4Fe-4S dicluster domain-containing protein [Kordiimonadaceae bacterium]|jgi:epoxyqueuosine reductase QueG|nr:4Fe-4S dicluster domain-containing protein [Kordiimonadaceae bacterium]MBT6036109.1 4Fe-4S dicluster domain-containing protein [Kordiimonadaceae bacterium]MBT6330475.1 4Fe-4S dicluster domain-containing protein [Kordiimonadaceae bacterium]